LIHCSLKVETFGAVFKAFSAFLADNPGIRIPDCPAEKQKKKP